MIALSVNLNKIALLRNARGQDARPALLDFARLAMQAGAAGLTVHPRPDQRHIRVADVPALAAWLRTHYPTAEFNIEGNPLAAPRADGYPGLEALVEESRPAQVTLVPDGDGQLTSDHGWAMTDEDIATLSPLVARFKKLGARVSVFMDPNPEAISRVPETGADRIELYTEPFAEAFNADGRRLGPATKESLALFRAAGESAQALGLGVNAGHDLDLDNLVALRTLPNLLEVSIGHALIADALELGFYGAVARYRATLEAA
ncbi:MAG: pyridoxine 5'-phosphate synthase [Pseudomonadales bacterium]|nr:pyridoxine 5'-phosphate synthase [Pseudomonadales bacterium]MBL6808219.1 pyridoxine 5'-phosphate synthase [Pseudomonadales bacterium]